MALVSCPECQKEVSTQALACPQCAFPFPGMQAGTAGHQGKKLHACSDCGCPVSRQAQSCPHCGVRLIGEKGSVTVNGSGVEETWLCTHCGTPYTRKVSNGKEIGRGHQTSNQPSRRRSQLWQDTSLPTKAEKVVPIRYPRSRKKSILLGLLFFILIAASVVSGALWQLQSLNPLEALVYWRM
jgi:DNA-directed RNA polymerase subunit RPC12/RpoP